MSKISFLVVVDGTDEMEVSLKYACIKAKKTNGHLILASFIKPIDVLTTKSVEVISVAGLFGVISTWVLIRWNKILDQIDKMG